MKKTFTLLLTFCMFAVLHTHAQQDKSKRPSPPALATQTLSSGAVISIDYSQPSVKGRTIGKDLEPKDGEVWRTGANEATVFETSKDIKVNGQTLPAGKYGLFMISGPAEWTIIFNKTWKQWGAFNYKKEDDALRITAAPGKAAAFAEKMSFTIEKNGLVTLLWGDIKVSFTAE
ncbi:MAG: DUF2911 domain-containing protein [Ferruginibacter sp.]